jgi:hypothetical protein
MTDREAVTATASAAAHQVSVQRLTPRAPTDPDDAIPIKYKCRLAMANLQCDHVVGDVCDRFSITGQPLTSLLTEHRAF